MASKRHLRAKSCSSKRRYETFGAAIAPAQRLKLRIYHCNFCGGYHIGHMRAEDRTRVMQARGYQ